MNKYFFVLLAVLTLACGEAVNLPSSATPPASTLTRERVNRVDSVTNYATSKPADAQEDAAMTSGTVNVRKCAGLHCSVIGHFEPRQVITLAGAVVRVNTTNRRDCAEWQPVVFGDTVGYVCRTWVR